MDGTGKEEVLFACCHGDGAKLLIGPSAQQLPCSLSNPLVNGFGFTGSDVDSQSSCHWSPQSVAATVKSHVGQGFRKGGTGLRGWLQTHQSCILALPPTSPLTLEMSFH